MTNPDIARREAAKTLQEYSGKCLNDLRDDDRQTVLNALDELGIERPDTDDQVITSF